MLPKEYRLKQDKDFTRLFKQGRFFPGRGISMRIVANSLQISRFGFVVGTKVAKKAVKRNLLKRRMRAAVMKRLPGVVPGFDVAFIAGSGGAAMEFQDVENSIERHLRFARIMAI